MSDTERLKLAGQIREFRSYVRRRYRSDLEFRRSMLAQLRRSIRIQTRLAQGLSAVKH